MGKKGVPTANEKGGGPMCKKASYERVGGLNKGEFFNQLFGWVWFVAKPKRKGEQRLKFTLCERKQGLVEGGVRGCSGAGSRAGFLSTRRG